MPTEIVNEYDATLDERRRFSVRATNYKHYHVEEYADGTLILKPRLLIDPNASQVPKGLPTEKAAVIFQKLGPLDSKSLRAFQEAEQECERMTEDGWKISL